MRLCSRDKEVDDSVRDLFDVADVRLELPTPVPRLAECGGDLVRVVVPGLFGRCTALEGR